MRPSRSRSALNLLITVAGVISVALVGLVIEDLIPNRDDQRLVWWRVGLAVFAMAALLLAVRERSKVRVHFGTLYYVWFLGRTMPQTHLAEVRRHIPDHDDAKELVRWCVTPTPDNPTGWDLAADAAGLALELQTAFNSDRADTGFHVAPDMLWPIAVSVGYDIVPRPGTTVDELHAVAMEAHVDRWCLDEVSGPQLSTGPDALSARWSGLGGGATLVTAALTENVKPETVFPHASLTVVDIAAFVRDGANGQRRAVRLAGCRAGSAGYAESTAADMVGILTSTLREAVHQADGAPVFATLRVPKTVAFALGYCLRTRPCAEPRCVRPACLNVWRSLIPLNWTPGVWAAPYVPLRVHHDQPPLEALRATVGSY